jgi:hypothetical protein
MATIRLLAAKSLHSFWKLSRREFEDCSNIRLGHAGIRQSVRRNVTRTPVVVWECWVCTSALQLARLYQVLAGMLDTLGPCVFLPDTVRE